MTSNSKSIRDIEDKYGIDMTTCTRAQLDSITSSNSSNKLVRRLSDLMLNSHKFDIKNMTDIERANLKYLVMSTDEVLDVLKRKSKSIYYKPTYGRLRWLMSYNDFYQICAYKLLLNDGILRFNADYSFECAVHHWFNRVAWWQSSHKANVADEVTILDKPCNDDTDTTIGDLMLKDCTTDLDDNNLDASFRIDYVLSQMDKTASKRIVFKAGNTMIPFSEYTLAKLFIIHKLGKKELSKMMFNTSNNKVVSNQIFNKFYKQTMLHIADILNKEAIDCEKIIDLTENDL